MEMGENMSIMHRSVWMLSVLVIFVASPLQAQETESEAGQETGQAAPVAPMPSIEKHATTETLTPNKPTSPESGPVGLVMARAAGYVTIDIGHQDGLEVGDSVQFFHVGEINTSHGTATQVVPLSIGRVLAVNASNAKVELGINERIFVGDRARKTRRPMFYDTLAPPRLGDIWEISLAVRPFLTLDHAGMGLLADASIGYRFRDPIFVRLVGSPSGVAITNELNIGTGAAHLYGGYDGDSFEIGLGAGVSRVNEAVQQSSSSLNFVTGSGFSLGQTIRLGAHDGANLEVQTAFTFFGEQWKFTNILASLQFPVTHNAWAQLRGGGGGQGYMLFEAVLRMLLHGNGDKGSFYLAPRIGWAEIYRDASFVYGSAAYYNAFSYGTPAYTYQGPMIGVGVEVRL